MFSLKSHNEDPIQSRTLVRAHRNEFQKQLGRSDPSSILNDS